MIALPGPRLDPATLLFSSAVMGFVMAAFSFSAARSMPNQSASLRDWGWAMSASGAAFLLYFLRGHIDWNISFIGGNALILLAPVLILQAQMKLVGSQLQPAWVTGLLVWGLSGLVISVVTRAGPTPGAITVSSSIAVVALVFMRQLSMHPVSRTLPGARYAAAVGALTALTLSWRTWVAATGELPNINADAAGGHAVHTGSLLMGALFLAATSISFFTMAHELRRRETEDSARRDGLTGVLTRAAFYELAEALHAQRPRLALAVAMVDMDHFKSVNDQHGHATGDLALAHMARLISGSMRSTDLIGRYGGEEFVVLLRGADAATALRFGQRLVELAERTRVRLPDAQPLRCTLSVGVACRDTGSSSAADESLDALVARADQALYQAKAEGRSRAVLADPLA